MCPRSNSHFAYTVKRRNLAKVSVIALHSVLVSPSHRYVLDDEQSQPEDGEDDSESKEDNETAPYKTRVKSRNTRADMLEVAAAVAAKGIRNVLPLLSVRQAQTMDEFNDAFSEYAAIHNVAYRIRHSLRVEKRNK